MQHLVSGQPPWWKHLLDVPDIKICPLKTLLWEQENIAAWEVSNRPAVASTEVNLQALRPVWLANTLPQLGTFAQCLTCSAAEWSSPVIHASISADTLKASTLAIFMKYSIFPATAWRSQVLGLCSGTSGIDAGSLKLLALPVHAKLPVEVPNRAQQL